MLTPVEESRIAYYFRAQSYFERSTSGPMLERADRLGSMMVDDGTGKMVLKLLPWENRLGSFWRQPATDAELVRSESPLDFIDLHTYGHDYAIPTHEQGEGGGYEPDVTQLIAFAESGRRMLAVERVDPMAKCVLEAYYGDRGHRWAVFGTDRTDPETGSMIHGAGPGSIAAVFMLTGLGAELIKRERRQSADLRGKNQKRERRAIQVQKKIAELEAQRSRVMSMLSEVDKVKDSDRAGAARSKMQGIEVDIQSMVDVAAGLPKPLAAIQMRHLTDDEVLENVFIVQAAQPDASRRARLNLVRSEAEEALVKAWGVWLGSSGDKHQMPRRKTRAWQSPSLKAIGGRQ